MDIESGSAPRRREADLGPIFTLQFRNIKDRYPYLFSAVYLVLFLTSLFSSAYGPITYLAFSTVFASIFIGLGNSILIREGIALLYTFTCILMPWVSYEVYNTQFELTRMFGTEMKVSKDTYFSNTLPAILVFVLVLTWPVQWDHGSRLLESLGRIRESASRKTRESLTLFLVGTAMLFVSERFLPLSFRFFGLLIYFSTFASLLYVRFSDDVRLKSFIYPAFALSVVYNSLSTGMFTIIAYMGLTIFSFFFLGKRIGLVRKLAFLIGGIVFILVLQNSKVAYRKVLWKNPELSMTQTFIRAFTEQFQRGTALIEKRDLFPVQYRMNQGLNISRVMRRFPNLREFDDGAFLFKNVASSLVPRLLWPDKPQAGGSANMQYYAGIRIVRLSTNVGPYAEGYASFGPRWAVFFMGLLAFLVRGVYLAVFRLSNRIPLLILWLPVIFYQTVYSAETDTLQILNSILKTVFFLWIFFKVFPTMFLKGESEMEYDTPVPG